MELKIPAWNNSSICYTHLVPNHSTIYIHPEQIQIKVGPALHRLYYFVLTAANTSYHVPCVSLLDHSTILGLNKRPKEKQHFQFTPSSLIQLSLLSRTKSECYRNPRSAGHMQGSFLTPTRYYYFQHSTTCL